MRSAPTGKRLWRYDFAPGAAKTFASEVVAADLNRDGKPELVFGTYSLTPRGGRLVVLSATGKLLHDVRLRNQRADGNGIGVPAAPSIGDLDRGRAARDRADDLRPRHRCLPRAGVGDELPPVADRPCKPAPERRRPGRRSLSSALGKWQRCSHGRALVSQADHEQRAADGMRPVAKPEDARAGGICATLAVVHDLDAHGVQLGADRDPARASPGRALRRSSATPR